jgi:methionyl-tRNA formyltransferase
VPDEPRTRPACKYGTTTDISIKKAIGAHGLWKSRLNQAIATGNSEFSVSAVTVDNGCDFGKWLYSLNGAEATSTEYLKVKTLHAEFHRSAAEVLKLAIEGHPEQAQSAMASNSPFAKVSAELTTTMMRWKDS